MICVSAHLHWSMSRSDTNHSFRAACTGFKSPAYVCRVWPHPEHEGSFSSFFWTPKCKGGSQGPTGGGWVRTPCPVTHGGDQNPTIHPCPHGLNGRLSGCHVVEEKVGSVHCELADGFFQENLSDPPVQTHCPECNLLLCVVRTKISPHGHMFILTHA